MTLKYQGKFKITKLAKINFNVSLITEVPGKQLSFYIEALQELVNASARNSKWSWKSISTWDKKSKSTAKAKFVMVLVFSFSVPQRVCPQKNRKEGRFRRHPDLLQLGTPLCFSQNSSYSTELFSFPPKAFRGKEKNSALWRHTSKSPHSSLWTSLGFSVMMRC